MPLVYPMEYQKIPKGIIYNDIYLLLSIVYPLYLIGNA